MPDFPIIDAHLHVYDPEAISYPWMAGVPALNRPHMPRDFFAATGRVEIEGAVFVEVDAAPHAALDEARFVAEAAKAEPRLLGIVAGLQVDRGAETLAGIAALKAQPMVRGVRHLIQGHVGEPGWCLRDAFVAGVQAVGAAGLSFDICILHPQLGDATELVRRCPDMRFVLDHIGKPGIRGGLTEPWREQMRALARLDNVSCKISGATTEADHSNWTEAEVAPYLAHAIDCFGYDRVIYGGDWPVSSLATPYDRWVALVDSVVAGASPSEQQRLYRDNAIAFYRL